MTLNYITLHTYMHAYTPRYTYIHTYSSLTYLHANIHAYLHSIPVNVHTYITIITHAIVPFSPPARRSGTAVSRRLPPAARRSAPPLVSAAVAAGSRYLQISHWCDVICSCRRRLKLFAHVTGVRSYVQLSAAVAAG